MNQPRVFISYSGSDTTWARSFAQALKERGIEVWLYELQINVGESVRESLEDGLRTSDVLVTLIDPNSSLKPNTYFELGVAIGLGKRFVPIVPREVDTSKLPFVFRTRHYLSKDSPEDTADELVQALAA